MSKSSDYWRKREEEWLAQIRKSEKAQADEVQAIYDYMLDEIEKEINSFFEKYAAKEGISMAEAKKRADTIDIEAYMRKAAKYVKEKDFSDQANKEMLLYNMTMKVNRLELLKSSIGLDLVAGHDELKTYMGDKLTDHVVETLRHNAAILGPTVMNDADRKARVIVNSSFHNATFSDRIWQHQDKLRNEMTNILTSALIGGRNPREFIPTLRKRFDVSARDAERLLRTELARVQTEAQKESYKDENINEYEYIACGLADCCDICRVLDGKHFKVSKMVVGENAPPRHPNCHCSTGPYLDFNGYDEWLDSYKDHGLNYEEWKKQKSLDTNGIEHYLRNNLPSKKSGFKDTRHVGNYISDKDLKRLSSKAASLDIRLGADKNSYGNFELYRGDVKVLENVIDTLGDQLKRAKNNHLLKQSSNIILTYDNVLGYEGDNSMIDVDAFAMTKGKTIILNKFMYDDSDYLKSEYESAVQDNSFPKGTTYENVVIHEFGHIIDRNNPKIRQDILHVLQQDASNVNMALEKWILENISDYATSYSEIDNQFLELVPEANNAHNGTESEYVDDILKRAGVKL